MCKSRVKSSARTLVLCVVGAAIASTANCGELGLVHAPANSWVKLVDAKTGGRVQPLFVYAAGIKRFVYAGGSQGKGYETIPRHYDTEEFDLTQGKWFNAYPKGLEAGRPESGPVGADYFAKRERHGNDGTTGHFYKDGDYQRITCGGQWAPTNTGSYAWCYVPENGKIFVSPGKTMLVYDTVKRTWEEINNQPRETNLVWGSMCYDSLNKEILHSCGGGGSAELATWVYSLDKNQWRKLECGTPKIKELFARAKNLRWQAKTLLGRCASRHAVAETAEEAKVNLSNEAVSLVAAAEKFAGEIAKSGLTGTEKAAGEAAAKRLAAAVGALQSAASSLSGNVTADKIASVRAVRVIFEQVVDALSPQPPGRARAQTVFDPVYKKIILFGGDGLDRTLSDTWIYDCATRTWEQKFPETCPSPRAGHILAWLPKATKVVLAGGYSRHPLEQEVWTYDVANNSWQMLFKSEESSAPHFSLLQVGAVNEDDTLICPSNSANREESDVRVTWACCVDASKVDIAGTKARGVVSGTYDFNQIDPAIWEKEAHPADPAKMRAYYAGLPSNQWTSLAFPRYAPGSRDRFGTSAYDTDRHQFLFWGGGHATSHENDVGHFSLLGGFWTIGYHPDDPIEPCYASQPVPLSFNDRMHLPMHAYKGYCYDSTAKKMFYMDRAYDPLVREWLTESTPGIGALHTNMTVTYGTFLESTPKGAVLWDANGLNRYDAQAGRWQKLPWKGPTLGAPWCDGHAMVYDSKRDCLWFSTDNTIMRYDMPTGTATKIEFKKPKALGNFIFFREAVFVPEADLIMILQSFKRPDGKWGNAVWNPNDGKFYWVDCAFVESGKPVEEDHAFDFHSNALAYDPDLKILVVNEDSFLKVWAMRFDPKTAKLKEMTDN